MVTMSREVVFFFRNDAEEGGRDWIKYLSVDERDLGAGHGLSICGACFIGENLKEIDTKTVTTFLKKKELKALFNYDAEIDKLGYSFSIRENPEKMAKATELYNEIAPIIEKLKSEENQKFFEKKILPEEMDYLKDEFNLSDKDLETIFDDYYQEYRDRAVVGYVFKDTEDLGREEAFSLGIFNKDNERLEQYFNYEDFGSDLLNDDEYVELDDGRIARLSY
jgi:hypothetical protein